MNSRPDITIRTTKRAAEIAWFAALCSDDYEYLGVPDKRLRSSFEHCSSLVKLADESGYQNVLHSTSWVPGQDALGFAYTQAVLTKQINQLVALRMGEVHPPMLARSIATLDHITKGRLTLNIISSDMPGMKESNSERYARSEEVLQIIKQCWTQDTVDFQGRFYKINALNSQPAKPYQINGGPLLYFGGISPLAVEFCAKHCDVFLMWPEKFSSLAENMQTVSVLAGRAGRTVDFGLRIHVIVRETEKEAREAARKLVSKLDDKLGEEIKSRAQDRFSTGVLRQDALRLEADADGYLEDNLWSGIGRGRSGCGSAIVGDPDQVYAKLQAYMDLGFRSFILSGYPHHAECDLFARYVLPRMETCRLNEVQGRLPGKLPAVPMTAAVN